MPTPIPPLPPAIQQKAEEHKVACSQVLDRYVNGIHIDMNRHAVKHGPMDPARAHSDLRMMLARDLDVNMLAGLLAEAILRGIAGKAKGRG